MLVVTSKVKELAKVAQLRTGADFINALSKIVGLIVIEAAKNARKEKCGTIKSRHLDEVDLGVVTKK